MTPSWFQYIFSITPICLFWFGSAQQSLFSDLGLPSDPCTAARPSFSLSLSQPFLLLPRMWNTFCRPGIFTREFVGKTGDGGNCRGGVMRGSRLSRPLTSNASQLFYSHKQRIRAFLFALLLSIQLLLFFTFPLLLMQSAGQNHPWSPTSSESGQEHASSNNQWQEGL